MQFERRYINKNKTKHTTEGFIPFEIHAYDALLTMIASLANQEFNTIDKEIGLILKQFQQKGCILGVDAQENMRYLKNTVMHMTKRLESFQKALDDVVEDDEEMSLMNLSLLTLNPKQYKYPVSKQLLGTHEGIEELLENYLNEYNSIECKLIYMKAQMQSAEELVSLRLDTARNQLLVANTAFAVLACAISTGSYLTGAFGMNLDNTITIQNQKGSFSLVFGLSAGFIAFMFAVIIWYLRYTGILPSEVDSDDLEESEGFLHPVMM